MPYSQSAPDNLKNEVLWAKETFKLIQLFQESHKSGYQHFLRPLWQIGLCKPTFLACLPCSCLKSAAIQQQRASEKEREITNILGKVDGSWKRVFNVWIMHEEVFSLEVLLSQIMSLCHGNTQMLPKSLQSGEWDNWWICDSVTKQSIVT